MSHQKVKSGQNPRGGLAVFSRKKWGETEIARIKHIQATSSPPASMLKHMQHTSMVDIGTICLDRRSKRNTLFARLSHRPGVVIEGGALSGFSFFIIPSPRPKLSNPTH